MDATLLLDRYAVVSDVAVVQHHTGAVALWTASRPDEVEQAPVYLDGVSRTAEALARATIHPFYGINVTAWSRAGEDGAAVVREGAAAVRPVEAGHLGDLVRAWFILTGFPLPAHLLVVPKALAEQDVEAVRGLVGSLHDALAVGNERRRELRRNLADEYGLDRERLLELQGDQTTVLSKTARKAWLDLLRRVSHAMRLPPPGDPMIVTVEPEG